PRLVFGVQRFQPAGASILIGCLSCQFSPTVYVASDVSIGRCSPHRQGSHSHESPMTFLACAQSLFCSPAFINVDHQADPFAHIAIVVTYRRSPSPDVAVGSVALSDSKLDLIGGLVPQRTLFGFKQERFVNWMDYFQITEA